MEAPPQSLERDVFILFNERENEVVQVVEELEKRNISTYFFRRDIELGEEWVETENKYLHTSRFILLFLGEIGWGENHLRIANEALSQYSEKIIPVVIGIPDEKALNELDGFFITRRYLDLTKNTEEAFNELERLIKGEPEVSQSTTQTAEEQVEASAGEAKEKSTRTSKKQTSEKRERSTKSTIDGPSIKEEKSNSNTELSQILSALIDGPDEERVQVLETARKLPDKDKTEVHSLFRNELEQKYSVEHEIRSDTSKIDVDQIPFIRSWLLTAMIATVNDNVEELSFILDYLKTEKEPNNTVRFWILTLLYGLQSSILNNALTIAKNDPSKDVSGLAELISSSDSDFEEEFFQLSDQIEEHPYSSFVENVRNLVMNIESDDNDSPSNSYLAGYTSDTAASGPDALGIENDVDILTAVMMSTDVTPPLAIGLFGDWGSGKSFFMNKMKESAEQRENEAIEKIKNDEKTPFCSSIVQIDFNAWHYVDSNLWASLVSHIFDELFKEISGEESEEEKKIRLENEIIRAEGLLGEANHILEQAEIEVELAIKNLTAAKESFFQQQHTFNAQFNDLKKILTDGSLNESLENATRELGMSSIKDSYQNLEQTATEIQAFSNRFNAILKFIFDKPSKRIILPATGLIVAILVLNLIPTITAGSDLLDIFGTFQTSFVAIASGVSIWFGQILKTVNPFLETIEDAFTKASDLRDEKLKNDTKKEKEALEIARQKQAVAHNNLELAEQKKQQLKNEFENLKPGRKLYNLIKERSGGNVYNKHLGIISLIRKDFEKMSELLRKSKNEASDGSAEDEVHKKVDRIILYIDDLDRCPPEKVMEVLQAVHLLLAFPLFVVVVGVDPRWLIQSLRSKHQLFEKSETVEEYWKTTPQNYLEKIFQIPYNLQPMTLDGYEKLVDSLLLTTKPEAGDSTKEVGPPVDGESNTDVEKPVLKPEDDSTENDPDPIDEEVTTVLKKKPDEEGKVAFDPNKDPEPSDNKESLKSGIDASTHDDPESEVSEVAIESLFIQSWETDFAKKLYTLISTPRGVKRFTNTYRILKASVKTKDLPAFEGTKEEPGDFEVPMLLLAILIGNQKESVHLFPHLYDQAKEEKKSFQDALKSYLENPLSGSKNNTAFYSKIKSIVNEGDNFHSSKAITDWIPKVTRFSFETGRAINH